MAQLLYPISDITTTNVNAGTYASIDEVSPSDADYIIGTNANTAVYECLLTDLSGTPPGPGASNCTIDFRMTQADHDTSPFVQATVGNGYNSITVEVYQGTTQVYTSTAFTNTSSWVTQTLTNVFNSSSISNWADVRLRFTITGNGGTPAGRRTGAISWARLTAPDPAVAQPATALFFAFP